MPTATTGRALSSLGQACLPISLLLLMPERQIIIKHSYKFSFQSLPPFVSAEFLDAVQTVQSETLFYNEVSIKFVQVQSDMKSMLNTLTENQIKVSLFC